MIQASPAQVVHAFLKAQGAVQNTNQKADWWAVIGKRVTEPDNAVFVYDTTGIKDGKLMTGDQIVHHGIQVVVRGFPYTKAYTKAQDVIRLLSAAARVAVVVGAETVTLCSFTLTSPVMHLGQENDQVREMFSLNGTVTLQEP